MIIYKNIDSVWINSSIGVTVYFSYNHLIQKMTAYIRTPCGVGQHINFGSCTSIADGREQLLRLTTEDADNIYAAIKDWPTNQPMDDDYFLQCSYTEPLKFLNHKKPTATTIKL